MGPVTVRGLPLQGSFTDSPHAHPCLWTCMGSVHGDGVETEKARKNGMEDTRFETFVVSGPLTLPIPINQFNQLIDN